MGKKHHYYSAKKRCLDGKYSVFGYSFDLTKDDVERLWIRDNADGMNSPSLDRIDTTSGYNYNNCRFIELIDNKKRPRNKSLTTSNRFKGVYWQKSHKKFRVVVTIDGKLKHIGYYSNQEEAASIYNNFIYKQFGSLPINKI